MQSFLQVYSKQKKWSFEEEYRTAIFDYNGLTTKSRIKTFPPEIVKEINDKINQFQLTYANKDKQDCLSMAILTYAVDLHKFMQADQPEVPNPELDNKLNQIDELLNKLLV